MALLISSLLCPGRWFIETASTGSLNLWTLVGFSQSEATARNVDGGWTARSLVLFLSQVITG